ncbi:MAG: peptidase prolyl oligopeptidase active site domain protein [Candidatus Solibacter sp.]|nr:peptidase prolyl oligopeptidase active site domain protein [Candidatus Solibacter sp.]
MRFTALALLISTAALSAARAPWTLDDWWTWREISSPRINPDGDQAVYVETWNNRATDTVCANLWQVATPDGTPRRITDGPWRDSSPRWSADNRLAWISDRTGTPQIWIRRIGGPDKPGADKLTDVPDPPQSLAWSPDGKSLAFTARAHLFLVPAAGGPVRAIPLGDLEIHGDPAWMPDGQSILVAAAPPPDAAHVLEGAELYAIRIADGTRRQITHHHGPDIEPVPSPDGSRLAWIAREPKPQSYVVAKLYVANPDGSRAKILAGSLDRDIRHPQWSSDSRTVYFLADDHGTTRVYAARSDGSVRQVTTAPARLTDFSVADTGRAVTVRAPAELVTFPVDLPAKPVTLAAPNRDLIVDREPALTEEISYPSDGKTIQAWILKPPAFDPAKKYPLLLDIDDDPRRMCGPDFRFHAQLFAARGFVVLCANPRGTPGYGEEFGNLIRSRYPGDDFDDLLRGVDAVIAKGFIDPAKLTIKGGLLAAWAIGHTTRFHAAIAVRPIADWATEITSAPDGLYRAATLMGAMPWDDPDQYVKHSPLYFAAHFQTPTLVISTGRDPGSDQLVFALQARNVESRRLRLDTPTRPSQQISAWEEMSRWAAR